jgi:hypothetical protein
VRTILSLDHQEAPGAQPRVVWGPQGGAEDTFTNLTLRGWFGELGG